MLARSYPDGIHIAFDAHQVLITQVSGCEALALQYGADCITSGKCRTAALRSADGSAVSSALCVCCRRWAATGP